jgi:hypothetical protein
MDVIRPPVTGTYSHAPTRGVKSRCQRSGLMFPYEQMVREPGTNLWVHRSYSDGVCNRVQHRNFRPPLPESQTIPNVFPEQDAGLIIYDWLIDGADGKYIEINLRGDFVGTGL